MCVAYDIGCPNLLKRQNYMCTSLMEIVWKLVGWSTRFYSLLCE